MTEIPEDALEMADLYRSRPKLEYPEEDKKELACHFVRYANKKLREARDRFLEAPFDRMPGRQLEEIINEMIHEVE